MEEGVIGQVAAAPEKQESVSDKELNFRRLESQREAEREARIKAEVEAQVAKQRADMLERDLHEIKSMLQPKEKDPLDSLTDDYVDRNTLKAIRERDKAQFLKEAEAITRSVIQGERDKEKKTGFLSQLRQNYRDYDDVVNEQTILGLSQTDPEFLEAVTAIPDEYIRREKTYNFIKKKKPAQSQQKEDTSKALKDKVQENQENPYYIAPSVSTPSAVDFDVRSKSAREAAYQKLKDAQKRPVGPRQGY